MGWDPDGSGIFFYSNRDLGRGIWKLSVADGRVTGTPELVRGDVWDLIPRGFSGDQYFYEVVRASAQVRTATLDIASGQVVTPPTMIREPAEGWSRDPAWSADGRYLAFLDYPANIPWGASQARLGIRSVYTGETRYLSFPFPSGAELHWGPDSEEMMVIGRHGGVSGIHRLDLRSGEITLLRERPELGPQSALSLSPDGSTYYFHRDRSEIWAGDVATGRETLLARVDGVLRRIGVSPDGQTLVLRAGDFDEETRLVVLPASGGEPREIYRGQIIRGGGFFLAITPDGHYVVVASFAPPASVWRFSMDGGEPVKLLEGESPRSFRLSPDGRRIAYWDWPDQDGATELWVIEGLTSSRGR
jgi:Tol biopolymer transport system component